MKGKCCSVGLGVFLLFQGAVLADIVSRDGTIVTSLIRLIAQPERYDGKRVLVRGYFVGGFEVSGLFVVKDLANLGAENGIWVTLPDPLPKTNTFEKVTRGYVTVAGTFRYREGGSGHLGGWPAELMNVTLFVRAP